ncbi:PspC domain-containing protein [Solicola gregarius]|uniref:PspC domain-containing protein n=1 Tax=Solicola gregarius TaxID=2908642 RepID=A0AA46TET2_9ACTN|nr:PspC domain-containing protein [Solicola gregarius]UYM03873.1 PspC domain-containing protein [Solicola gregarius]
MSDQSADDASEFDPRRVRTLASMRRNADDRMVAGVCSGAARYLNIDPVVVRVVVASLAFVGFAGVIVYVAAWLLVPEDDEDESLVDQHLPESVDREQVRRIGLFLAAAIAVASMLGSGFTFVDASIPVSLAALALFYIFVVVPYNKRRSAAKAVDAEASGVAVETTTDNDAATQPLGSSPPTGPPNADPPDDEKRPRNPRRDSGRLFGLTTAVAVIVVACMAIDSESFDWPYYPLAALLVVGAGMLVGTFYGNGRPLANLGIPLALLMLLTTVLPTYTVGDERHDPALASDIDDSYEQGIGNFVLDLTEISDLESLDGRTVKLDQGVGSMEIVVPDGLNLDVDAQTDAGSLKILGRSSDGAPVSLHYIDPADSDPVLHLDLEQTTGEIRVTRS